MLKARNVPRSLQGLCAQPQDSPSWVSGQLAGLLAMLGALGFSPACREAAQDLEEGRPAWVSKPETKKGENLPSTRPLSNADRGTQSLGAPGNQRRGVPPAPPLGWSTQAPALASSDWPDHDHGASCSAKGITLAHFLVHQGPLLKV